MHRSGHSTDASRRFIPAAIVLCLLLGFVPARYLALTGELADKANWIIAPISHPVLRLAAWLEPGRRQQGHSPEVARLQSDRDRYQTMFLRAQAEIGRLRGQISDLQRGIDLNPALPVRQLSAQVIRRQADASGRLLVIRGGARTGVTPNTVVVVNGVDLVGRVIRANRNTSIIQPITSTGAGAIDARIILRDDGFGARCQLRPVRGGLLQGLASEPEDPDSGRIEPIEPGRIVRLADQTWPANAQMLIVGIVERVDSAEDQLLRKIVTVRPRIDPARVTEVVLRITEDSPIPSNPPEGGP